ncbi:methyltransferase family protein [Engelhardtia mirabilis]
MSTVPQFFAHHRLLLSRAFAVLLGVYILFGPPPPTFAPWVASLSGLTGLALLAIAAFGRVWCLTFIAGKKNVEVVKSGPYSMVRNPLYVFSFVGAIGFGLAIEDPLLTFTIAAAFTIYYYFVVRSEEAYLLANQGESYQRYFDSTPRWIPRPSLYTEPDSVEIDPRRMRRGILDAMWFIWAYFLHEILEAIQRA